MTTKKPKGWGEAKVRRVLRHYEQQSAEDAVAEDEAGYHNRRETIMTVPVRLVPEVRKLIGRRVG